MGGPRTRIPDELLGELRELLDGKEVRPFVMDDEAVVARRDHLGEIVRILSELASWLAIDTFVDAGDLPPVGEDLPANPSRGSRRQGWGAVSLLLQIAADLGEACLGVLREGHLYSAAALSRQLIECEYLLLVMAEDFTRAIAWGRASNEELLKQFQPVHMRQALEFDADEYKMHCRIGGHPSPAGGALLSHERALRDLVRTSAGRGAAEWLVIEGVWIDVTNHVDRVLAAGMGLLNKHHARCPDGVPRVVTLAAEAEVAWKNREERDALSDSALATALLQLAAEEQGLKPSDTGRDSPGITD